MTRWQQLLIGVLAVTLVFIAVYAIAPLVALVVAILVVNTLLEQHKTITSRSPLDLEVISLGVAYVGSQSGAGWAVTLALIGPLLAHAVMGYFGDATVVKTASLLIVAAVASIVQPVSATGLFATLCVGYVVQGVLFVAILDRSIVTNIIARLSTAVLHGYIVFMLLPLP